MNKLLKSSVCLILCLVLLLPYANTVFAAEEKTCFIVVSGMDTFPLYNEDNEKVYPPSTQAVTDLVKKIASAAVKNTVNKNTELTKTILTELKNTFLGLACNNSGNSVVSLHTDEFDSSLAGSEDIFSSQSKDELATVYAGIQKYGAENTFFFNYDWRLDPLCHADSLYSFIQKAKSETGCTRVAVTAFSMGGNVVCSYLYKYGSNDINTITLCSTAFMGTSCVGDLFTKNVELSMTGLIKRLSQLTRSNLFENIIDSLNLKLSAYGINYSIENEINNFVSNNLDLIYNELIIPVFGNMPGLWALTDDKAYEQAKSVLLSNENAKLIERIDEYHYSVQLRAAELLKAAQKDTNVYIIAQYNMQGLPVSARSSSSNNDFLIDTCLASGGATCAQLGEMLNNDSLKQPVCGHTHISADNQIDASTCIFPEQTWFVKDMAHVDFPLGDSTDFILWLAESCEKLNVYSNEEYPQFLSYSYSDNTLKPLKDTVNTKTPADTMFDFLDRITLFFASIFTKIQNLFS